MLSFEIKINRDLISTGTVIRQQELAGTGKGWYDYNYTVMERSTLTKEIQETTFSGTIGHRYEEGALRLVGRVLDAVQLVKLDGDGKYGVAKQK